jgi:DNA-binding transcriptional ArsR family regulator
LFEKPLSMVDASIGLKVTHHQIAFYRHRLWAVKPYGNWMPSAPPGEPCAREGASTQGSLENMPHKRRKVRRQKKQKPKHSPQEALVKALNHPIRLKSLAILTERVASPKEISDEIEMPVANVAYHVRVLDELGLIEIREEESVRGSVEHFYAAVETPLIANAEWASLDPRVRAAVSGSTIEALINDVASSLAAGVFDKREDRQLTRTPLLLDEAGWQKVLAIEANAVDAILKEQAAAASRLNGSSAGIRAIVGVVCFEAAPDGDS